MTGSADEMVSDHPPLDPFNLGRLREFCSAGAKNDPTYTRDDLGATWLMQRVPVVDLSECIECDCCVEICPEVFKKNESVGYIEVVELEDYPEREVQDVINFCPADCIGWEYI